MARIGVRELKQHTSEILRRVREDGDSYVITRHGRVVAPLVPANDDGESPTVEEWLSEWRALSDVISATWPPDVSALQTVREERRGFE